MDEPDLVPVPLEERRRAGRWMLLAVTIVGSRMMIFRACPRSTWPQRPEPGRLGLAAARRGDGDDVPVGLAAGDLEGLIAARTA